MLINNNNNYADNNADINIDADANSAEMGQDSYTMNATGNDETIRTPSKHIINSNI